MVNRTHSQRDSVALDAICLPLLYFGRGLSTRSGGRPPGFCRHFAQELSHAFKSYRAWLVIVPTVAVVLFLGRSTTVIFIFALALAGFWEFARATGLIRERLMLVASASRGGQVG